jgi:hypothetical protein
VGKDFDEITISSSDGTQLGSFGPNLVDFGGGDATTGGLLVCRDQAGRVAVRLAGGDDQAGGGILSALGGALHLVNFQGHFRVRIFHGDALEGQDGGTILLDAPGDSGEPAIELNAATRSLHLRDSAGRDVCEVTAQNAALYVGVNGNEGDIRVRDGSGRDVFQVDGQSAAVYVGVKGNEGDIRVRDGFGRDVFQVDGQSAAVYVGAKGNEGDIRVRDGAGRDVFQVDGQSAAVFVGAKDNEGDIVIFDNDGNNTIHLDGGSGDIILSNADAAEDFTVAEGTAAVPGAVMVLGPDGALLPCSSAYDRKVVGVIAGAGSRRPAIVLDRNGDLGSVRAPISIVGKAACLADAAFGRIEAGDLLTSSPTVGYAMRASDARKAPGATIGKALTPLPAGRGLVEMVISLH